MRDSQLLPVPSRNFSRWEVEERCVAWQCFAFLWTSQVGSTAEAEWIQWWIGRLSKSVYFWWFLELFNWKWFRGFRGDVQNGLSKAMKKLWSFGFFSRLVGEIWFWISRCKLIRHDFQKCLVRTDLNPILVEQEPSFRIFRCFFWHIETTWKRRLFGVSPEEMETPTNSMPAGEQPFYSTSDPGFFQRWPGRTWGGMFLKDIFSNLR